MSVSNCLIVCVINYTILVQIHAFNYAAYTPSMVNTASFIVTFFCSFCFTDSLEPLFPLLLPFSTPFNWLGL